MSYIGNQPAPVNVGSDSITDGSIVNADINSSAAIAISKLDGVTATNTELNLLDGVTATTAELNLLDGVTATTTELNYVDGVTSAIQTQIDAKSPTASPTFTGTATAPTINASTALQIGGVAITSTAAELNILDGVTATATELNYNDITTLGLTQASKTVTADANGVVSFDNGTIEESTAITSSSNAATINLRDGNVFTHTLTENVTYTFSNPAASGRASAFILKVTQDSTARTISWPSSVDWAAATAPTLTTTSGGVDVFAFLTVDGGTTYYGFTLGQAMG